MSDVSFKLIESPLIRRCLLTFLTSFLPAKVLVNICIIYNVFNLRTHCLGLYLQFVLIILAVCLEFKYIAHRSTKLEIKYRNTLLVLLTEIVNYSKHLPETAATRQNASMAYNFILSEVSIVSVLLILVNVHVC